MQTSLSPWFIFKIRNWINPCFIYIYIYNFLIVLKEFLLNFSIEIIYLLWSLVLLQIHSPSTPPLPQIKNDCAPFPCIFIRKMSEKMNSSLCPEKLNLQQNIIAFISRIVFTHKSLHRPSTLAKTAVISPALSVQLKLKRAYYITCDLSLLKQVGLHIKNHQLVTYFRIHMIKILR